MMFTPIFVLSTALWAAPKSGAPASACERLVPCGHWEGTASQNWSDGVGSRTLATTLDVRERTPGVLRIVEVTTGEEVKTWTLDLKLAADDTFEVSQVDTADSRVIGSGRCLPNACFARLGPEFGAAGFSLDLQWDQVAFVVNQRTADGRAFTRRFQISARRRP